jgi:hypothetical protein
MTLEELKESGKAPSQNRVYYINIGTPSDEEVAIAIEKMKNK